MVAAQDNWLKLTNETPIDPETIICDPHHHLWYPASGGYSLEDFHRDISGGHHVVQTVFIESRKMLRSLGPPEMMPVGETEFIRELVISDAGKTSINVDVAAGIVGFADLTLGTAVAPVLEAHIAAGGGRFKGIRYITAWDASPKIKSSAKQSIMASPQFRKGFDRLSKYDLSFDAWLYYPQLMELAELARTFPKTCIVICHTGGLLRIGPYATGRETVFQEWKKAITELAGYDNVFIKLGGLGMEISGFAWNKRSRPPGSAELAECFKPYFSWCIEQFGVNRCMFESNFPVDKRAYSYTVLWNAFKRVAAHFSKSEKQALFYDTAVQFYRLPRISN
jgi:predicted TIM-barrel fold metal-dependent hydrolase